MVEAHRIDRTTRSLRLLWLIDSLSPESGEALIPTFARALEPGRVRLVVGCIRNGDGGLAAGLLAAEGIKVVDLRARNLRDVSAFRRLTRLLRIERIDVIHAHFTSAAIWAALAARRSGVPALASLHAPALAVDAGARERLRERLMVAGLNRWASRIVAVSDAVRVSYREMLDPARTVMVRNGVEVEPFALQADARAEMRIELGLSVEAPVLATVSALHEGRGLDVLLGAAARVVQDWPMARFLVLGEGPGRSYLEARRAALGLEAQVRFLGHRGDVPRVLAAADAFVMPSRLEILPKSVLEAMAGGLPVVATAVGGIPEVVAHGETGLLVAPGDEAGLADAIRVLLRDPERAHAMGGMGRLRVRDELSSAIWATRLRALYETALDAAGK